MINTLLSALETMVKAADEAHEHHYEGREVESLKCLSAMAGILKRYRADIAAVHDVIGKARAFMEKVKAAREAGPDPELIDAASKRLESRELSRQLASVVLARCAESASRVESEDFPGELVGCCLSLQDIDLARRIIELESE
jgi:hypothetical protein